MQTLIDTTFSGKNISSAASVYTYTATVDCTVRIQVWLDSVSGGGDYVAYITLNKGGVASDSAIGPKTTYTASAGETSFLLVSQELDIKEDDVIKVFIDGLSGDTNEAGSIRIFSDNYRVNTGITVGTGARSTMADIIAELRMMASAGTADYSLAGADFWSDSQLQDILDRNAWTMDAQTMTSSPKYISGAYEYTDYFVGRGWLEQSSGGTAIFVVQDLSGNTIASADYSVDYAIGQVTFDTDTGGEAYLVSCVSYDMNAAAADVWRKKANYYFSAVNFSTDNHRVDREQIYQHCIQQAQRFEAMSWGANESIDLVRSDDLIDG